MLVISRKLGEKTYLVDKATQTVVAEITVVMLDRNKVRLGIVAPATTAIYRKEIAPAHIINEQTPPGTGQHPENLRLPAGPEAAGTGPHVP